MINNDFNLKHNRTTANNISKDMQMSQTKFNVLMGGTILWGLICNFLICVFFETQIYGLAYLNPIVFILGYFALALLGATVQKNTTSAFIAFLGFNLICLPIGAVLSICVSEYSILSISYVCLITGAIVAIMIIISSMFPDCFSSLGPALFASLIGVIIVEFVLVFLLGYNGHMIDYLVAALFSLYVGYDWYNSQKCAATSYNAICCATDLYLDIINIFVRLLEILGKKKK